MNNVPPAVRVLPMNLVNEFPDGYTIENAQQWFREELPCREDGAYRCYTGLQAELGTVVLFQCEAQVIAAAVLTGCEQFAEPDEDGYKASLYFNVRSIRTFDPVGPEAFRRIWPEFKRFSQVKQGLNPERYAEFERQLTGVRSALGI